MTKPISIGYVYVCSYCRLLSHSVWWLKFLVRTTAKSSTPTAAERNVIGYLSVSKLQVNENKNPQKGKAKKIHFLL